jgi:hypothetical protein
MILLVSKQLATLIESVVLGNNKYAKYNQHCSRLDWMKFSATCGSFVSYFTGYLVGSG